MGSDVFFQLGEGGKRGWAQVEKALESIPNDFFENLY